MEKSDKSDNFIKDRLQLLAEQKKGNIGYKVLDLLLASVPFHKEIGEFFYKSDILDAVTNENLQFFMDLVAANADVKWFWLIEESYHGNGLAFEKYCAVFKKYYYADIGVDIVSEKYRSCSSVGEMDTALAVFLTGKAGDEKGKQKGSPSVMEEEAKKENVPKKSGELQIFLNALEEFRDVKGTFKSQSDFITQLQEENKALTQCISDMRLDIKALYSEVIQYKKKSLAVIMQTKTGEHSIKECELKLRVERKKSEQLLARIRQAESINSHLRDNNTNKERKCQELLQENGRLLKKISELEKKNQEENSSNKAAEGPKESRKEAPQDAVILKADVKAEAAEPKNSEAEMKFAEYAEGNIVPITDEIASIREKGSLFARLFSRYHEKAFMKKSLTDQEGIIFVKMLELQFDKDKVLFVKKMMRGDEKISLIELYKLISKNPSVEELNRFYNSVSAV